MSDLHQPWSRLVNNIKCRQRNMTNRVSQMIDRVNEDVGKYEMLIGIGDIIMLNKV